MKKKTSKEEILYCRHCGAKLILRTRPQEENKFNANTGKPTGAVWSNYKCPNKFIFFDSHDEYDDKPIPFDI